MFTMSLFEHRVGLRLLPYPGTSIDEAYSSATCHHRIYLNARNTLRAFPVITHLFCIRTGRVSPFILVKSKAA